LQLLDVSTAVARIDQVQSKDVFAVKLRDGATATAPGPKHDRVGCARDVNEFRLAVAAVQNVRIPRRIRARECRKTAPSCTHRERESPRRIHSPRTFARYCQLRERVQAAAHTIRMFIVLLIVIGVRGLLLLDRVLVL